MAPHEGQIESVGARARVQTGQFIGVRLGLFEILKTRVAKTCEYYQSEL